ncbi:MAG: DUF2909 family protein [Reinekea forsetii]|jgi:hypothetical protein|uniref:DUF2909 domain-containing protein n=1 Tax=Reinekea forsetii TaxID=1336806 RepID=A0A2K8KM28_9GAMM|nr:MULTISPECIES: DUF2909 family protein [Reinekea]ATX75199.1 hypothetical protein REIFOR_00021 [Reinekea forsetii]MDO7672788.1 DUF2909 family protein [Reinekea forsetii]
MFKVILVILVIAMLVSLSGALGSLFNNAGHADRPNTFNWLILRISIAVAMLLVILIGFVTGELSFGAPWSGQY